MHDELRDGELSVLMVSPEAVPFSKTGGLGDVAGALPLALDRLRHRVTLVVPRYAETRTSGAEIDRFTLPLARRLLQIALVEHRLGERSRALLVDCPELYDREGLYGVGPDDYPDNPLRFATLALAALEHAARSPVSWSAVHAHDWQSALVPVYLDTRFRGDRALWRTARVLTIHNLAFQGNFGREWMQPLALDPSLYHVDRMEYWGRISFLKGGINASDIVTAVSRTYASEILTPALGFGFDGILSRRREDLVGIPNGIDTDEWDPARDPFLPQPFSLADVEGKSAAKRELLRVFGLPPVLDRPLVGIVSRLVDQKGHGLIAEIQDALPRLDAAFAVVGTGEAQYVDLWLGLAARHPDRIAVKIAFDERLAHLVEGGADIFLMPSLFEPAGLNQMYSMRYGTVPVVRATGGLDDTVDDVDPRTGRGTGFKFNEASGGALLATLARALAVYRDPEAWRALQRAGMERDFSWNASAREYVKVYRRAAARAARRRHQS